MRPRPVFACYETFLFVILAKRVPQLLFRQKEIAKKAEKGHFFSNGVHRVNGAKTNCLNSAAEGYLREKVN